MHDAPAAPASIIALPAACESQNAPLRLVSIETRQSSGVTVSAGP